MITLSQFVDKWNGKGIDFDGSYGNQCVDLYRMYVKEVLGLAQTPPVMGAKDIWTSETNGFEKITNTPDGFPLPGDVMIWGSKYGPYGHVAVVTQADKDTFTCFSQNDPAGALSGLKTYKAWSTLLGWLHPIKIESTDYKGYDLTNVDSMKVAVDVLIQLQSGELVRKADLDNLSKQITDLKKNLESLLKRVAELEGQDGDFQKQLESSSREREVLMADNQKLQEDLDYYKPYKARYENALTQVPNAMTGRQLIALGIKKLLQKK